MARTGGLAITHKPNPFHPLILPSLYPPSAPTTTIRTQLAVARIRFDLAAMRNQFALSRLMLHHRTAAIAPSATI
jgi:hypothetical protein